VRLSFAFVWKHLKPWLWPLWDAIILALRRNRQCWQLHSSCCWCISMLQRHHGQLCDASRCHYCTSSGHSGTRLRDRECMSEEEEWEREGTWERQRASEWERGRWML
jgi:hypothetical protein